MKPNPLLDALSEIARTGDEKSKLIAREVLNLQRLQSFAEYFASKIEHEGTVHVGEFIFGFDDGFCYTKDDTTAKLLEADCTVEQMVNATVVVRQLHPLGYRLILPRPGSTAWFKRLTYGVIQLTYPGDDSAPMDHSHQVCVHICDPLGREITNFTISSLNDLPLLEDGQKI